MAYNSYGNYWWNTPQAMPTVAQPVSGNYFAWVQGEQAAQAYQVAPGSTVMLMDSDRPVLYMKSADNTGRPSPMQKMYLVSEEDYNKIQNGINSSDFITKEEFNQLKEELESKFVIRKDFRNGKSSV